MNKTDSKIIKWIEQGNSNERIAAKLGRKLDDELEERINLTRKYH